MLDGVYVNGQGPYRFLLDTGTNMNLMESRLAKKIGMRTTFSDVVESAAGKISMPGSDGNIVELGPVRAEQQRFQYSDLDSLHMLWPDIRGVLGQAFLAGFDYTLDLRGKQLEFGKQDAKREAIAVQAAGLAAPRFPRIWAIWCSIRGRRGWCCSASAPASGKCGIC